jgi:hypothetical protein
MTIAEPSDPANNTVTIINPWNSDKPCTITWDQLAALNVDYIEALNIKCQSIPQLNTEDEIKNIINDYCSSKWATQTTIENVLNNISNIENIVTNTTTIYNNEGLFTGSIHKIEFDYNNKHYALEQIMPYDQNLRDGKRELFEPNKLSNYTSDMNLINQYFELAVSIDGEPVMYILKDGVTFEYFTNAVNDQKTHNKQAVNDLFSPFENGEINESTLINQLCSQKSNLNNEQKKLACNKLIELCMSGKINLGNLEFILEEFGILDQCNDIDSEYTNGIMYHKFVFDSKEYKIFSHSKNIDKNNERHTSDEVLNYTQDENLINEYFELAASIDGEAVMYILKNGVTFEDFTNAVQQKENEQE